MGMTPQQFFEAFVEGNLEDCVSRPGSVRLAFNAAISASHLADQYYEYNKLHNPQLVAGFKKIGDYVEHLSQATAEAFRDIRSVANAYKHLYTDVSSKHGEYSTIDSSGSIESIEKLGCSDIESVAKDYKAGSSVVVFTTRNGTTIEFLPVLETVVNYWRTIIRDGA